MFKTQEDPEALVAAAELRRAGWFAFICAALMLGLVIGRYEIPPSLSELSEAIGEPKEWLVENDPQKVRFKLGFTDFTYDELAGDVDAVIESLKLSGGTTVLFAPNRSLFGLFGFSGLTIWEVRHDTATIQSYGDIVRSRNMNTLGTVGIAAFFAALGAGFIVWGRIRLRGGAEVRS